MKKGCIRFLTIGLLTGMILTFPSLYASAAVSTIQLYVNGNLVQTETPPLLINGRTMVPIRTVSDTIGATVQWNAASQAVVVSDGTKHVTFHLKQYDMVVNGHTIWLDTPPTLVNDRTYIPLRALSESLSYAVDWDGATQRVSLQKLQENNISIDTKAIRSETNYTDVQGQYPVVSGLPQAVADTINQTLYSHVSYLTTINDDSVDQIDKNWTDQHPNEKSSNIVNYAVQYNQNGYLCITFEDYTYAAGAAHGMYVRSTYLFDLTTGKQLSLSDLFPAGQDYIDLINNELVKQYKTNAEAAYFLQVPVMTNENQFYVSPTGKLVIYFQPYEVAAYAAGIPEFTMPFLLPITQSSATK